MWLWIGLAIIGVLLFLLWLLSPTREGFQNTTGKASSFVVASTLQALTTPANLQTIGALEKGSYLDSYAVKTIENMKGEVLWKAGDPMLSDTVQAQYRLTFPNDVTLAMPAPSGTGGAPTPGKFQNALPSGIVYVGEAFTSPFLIVQSTIGELVNPYYLRILSTCGAAKKDPTAKQDPDYKVTKITDESGKTFYTWSNAPEKFKLVFAAPVSQKLFLDALEAASNGTNNDYVNLGFKRITLKGADFSSPAPDLSASGQTTTAVVEIADDPNVTVEGKLSVLVNPDALAVFKTFGDGSASDTYKVTSIQSADGTTVWSADERATKYRLEFAGPINLDAAKKEMPRKFAQTKFIGLSFADAPATNASYLELAAKLLPDRDTSAPQGQEEEEITKAFLTSFKEVQSPTDYSGLTYTDPRQRGQPVATATDVSTDTTLPTGPVVVTNRIKVRSKFSTLVTPEVIATLERGAGVTAEGDAPKVIEILDEAEKRIWPPTAGSTFVDPGIDSNYTIGYDAMIDVQNTIQPYITKFMPSISFLNPALPRRTT